jgi:sugar lactone lactonase YvrE
MNRKSIICIGLAFAFIHASAWAGTISTVAVIDANGGVTLDSAGDIYAANFEGTDTSSSLRFVWKLSPTGAFDPVIFASDIIIGSGNDFDSQDNLYQSNYAGDVISKIDPSGIKTTFSSDVNGPIGIAIDDTDNLYVSNCKGNSISHITPGGDASTFLASNEFSCPNGITRAANGDLYVINWNDGRIFHITPAGVISNFASVPSPGGHVTIAGERLYATSFGGHQIRAFELSGANAGNLVVTIGIGIAGSTDGSYSQSSFRRPNGITADATGAVLYVTDDTGVRKIELEDEATPPPPPPSPTPTPTPPPANSAGGGGSLGWVSLLGLVLVALRQRKLRAAMR